MKQVNRKEILDVIQQFGNGFFSLYFKKKDGSDRQLTTRLKITRDVKGEQASESAKKALKSFVENPANNKYIRLFDVNKPSECNDEPKGAWRTVNLETVYKIKAGGQEFQVLD